MFNDQSKGGMYSYIILYFPFACSYICLKVKNRAVFHVKYTLYLHTYIITLVAHMIVQRFAHFAHY